MPNLPKRVANQINAAAGSVFSITKSLVSSGITTVAADLTTVANGRLYIEDIIVETDATGLAGGTNFVISSNDPVGTATPFSVATSSLGASATINLLTATTKQRIVLGAGYKLQFASTGSVCTGPGVAKVTVIFRRLDDNARILPA